MRVCVLLLLTLSLGCGYRYLVIETPEHATMASARERVAAVRETLASFGLHQASISTHGEMWHDPGPPELRVTITVAEREVFLALFQEYPPPSPKCEELEELLLKNISERFGKGSIYVKEDDWDPL